MKDRPPLWTWAASFALAAIIVAGLLGWADRRASAAESLAYLHLERLRAAKSVPLIAVVGSSLTRCGIAADAPMELMLRRRGLRARLVRISRNDLTLERTQAIWTPLLNRPPKILILEANILRLARQDDPVGFDWRARIREEILRVNPARKVNAWETENIGGTASSCGLATVGPPTLAEYRTALGRRRAASPTQTQDVVRRLRALEAKGTTVWILDLPRNPRFEPYFPASLRAGGDRALRHVLSQTRAQMMPHRPQFSFSEFEDAAHLRPSGQARLSHWLADRIVDHLAEER